MRTLKAHLYCAGALWAFSGADRGSFALGGADPARQNRQLGDRRWVRSGALTRATATRTTLTEPSWPGAASEQCAVPVAWGGVKMNGCGDKARLSGARTINTVGGAR